MPRRTAPAAPLVFVTVGTDHHRFDRLVGWVDAWLERGASVRARCLVQSGTSAVPRVATSRDYLPHAEMEAAVREAVAIVCHGGPGTIMLCRALGKKPIVVPRLRGLGEHVDDHQVLFTKRLAAEGEISLATSGAEMGGLIDRALTDPTSLVLSPPAQRLSDTVVRFESMVAAMLATGSAAGTRPLARRVRQAMPRR
jgi:UDP-N-acetylglucosamine transferase subunit ALG13